MAKIKSVSNYNGTSWDTPIPLGADDANIDITSATTDPTTDTTATAAGLIAADVVAGEGDTDATAWTKFNKFRRRVYNAFNGVAGITVANSLVSSSGNSKVYSAAYINNYMTNVVGYSGTVTPTAGTIMDQLSNKYTLTEAGVISNNTNLNSLTTAGNYRGVATSTYSNAPVSSVAFILKVFHSTGGSTNSLYRGQLWITGYGSEDTNAMDVMFIRFTPDLGTTWSPWKKLAIDAQVVHKTGDVITGNLNFRSTVRESGVKPTNEINDPRIYFSDKNSYNEGWININALTSGTKGLLLYYKQRISNVDHPNYLKIGVDINGDPSIGLYAPAAWRNALGLGAVGKTTTSSDFIASYGPSFEANGTSTMCVWGKVAMFTIQVKCKTAITSASNGYIYCTVKSSYAPAAITTLTDSAGYYITFATTGSLTGWRSSVAAGTAVNLRGTYLLA